MLNEIKYPNLKTFSSMPLFQLLSEHPIEAARALLYFIESKGLNISKKSKIHFIEEIRTSMYDSLSRENPWLSSNNKVSFTLGVEKSSIDFVVQYNKKKSIEFSVRNFSLLSIDKEFSLMEMANTVFSEVADIVADIVEAQNNVSAASKYQENEVRSREMKKLRDKYNSDDLNIKILNKLASKYLFNLGKTHDKTEESISITPFFPNFNKTASSIYGTRGFPVDFKYTFQIENLIKLISILDKKLKNNGLLIQSFSLTQGYATLGLTRERGDKIKNDGYTFNDINKHTLNKVESIDLSKYEEMTFSGFKKNLIVKTFNK